MNKQNKKKKKKTLLQIILKRVKIRHFIILALLLVVNTLAWFIFIDTVNNKVDVRVKSWRIDFTEGDRPVTELVNITVSDVMPGMDEYNHTVSAYNYSEVNATVDYKILEARIMDEEYVTIEGKNERSIPLDGDELSSSELISRLATNYPFTITFSIDSQFLESENGSANFTVYIEWPFESGNDTWDTYWGIKAYDYHSSHPDSPSIELTVKLIIQQSST